MKSSGIKRSLAALAISGLAVTAIPAIASADPIDLQVTTAIGNPDGVVLYNTTAGADVDPIDLTTQGNGTVRLQAGGGVQVPAVTFQFLKLGVWTDIATVNRNEDGAFSHEWTPATNGVFPGDFVNLRVVNADDPNNPAKQSAPAGPFWLRLATATTTNSIDIEDGSQKGYFQDPDIPTHYTLGMSGATNVTDTSFAARPRITWRDGAGAAVNNLVVGGSHGTSNGGDGTWEGVLRFSDAAYPFDNPNLPPVRADEMVVRAETHALPLATQDQSDDFEDYTLYKQVLTTVTCTVAPQTEPDPGLVTIKVTDQNGAPIAGIDVYARDTNNNWGPVRPGSIETDGRGEITVPQDDDALYYYANADSANVFSPGAGDKRSADCNNMAAQVDITTAPSDGDIPLGTTVTETIKVTDPSGDPVSNRPVRIKREGPQDQSETKFATTNDNGEITYTFTCTVEGVAKLEVGIRGPNPIPPNDDYTWAVGRDTVNCKNPTPPQAINVLLRGKSSGGKDILTVDAPSIAKGATAVLQKKVKGKWVQVGKAKKLDGAGNRQWGTKDRNGSKVTKYRAIVSGNSKVLRDVSPVKRQR